MARFSRKFWITSGITVAAGAALVGWIAHGNPTDQPASLFEGAKPKIVDPAPEKLPSVGVLKSVGWAAGEAPVVPAGLTVSRFAEGLNHPRTMLTLPNGDVLVAETNGPAERSMGGVTGFVAGLLMKYVGAGGTSPDNIVLLRDDGSGKARRMVLRHASLESPSGMAWGNGKLYVANHNAVLVWDFAPGATELAGEPQKIMDLPGGGNHWMRNLLLSQDGKKLYVAIGSSSNIAEKGLEAEKGRAAIYEIDLASGHARQFAAGMRNANGMGWNPATGELWATVNERDQLGPNLVPDYLTNVPVGAHYGWPWVYWKNVVDERVDLPMPEFLTDYTRKPEYAMGPHVAALGLAFVTGGQRLGPAFANGVVVARHGSWNRKPPAGYDVVFVRFDEHGNPTGQPVPLLTGFLTGKGTTHGRPTWVGWAKDGALLVSDDTAGIIWRVIAPGAAPAAPVHPISTGHLPPIRNLNAEAQMKFGAKFDPDALVKQ
ncbi:MAG: sorbosone dehydrogenase family protein [Proteobacteria bacterium]|nr:sorbosone dehydrogenase family protein [Pseudomonadota bacterium]